MLCGFTSLLLSVWVLTPVLPLTSVLQALSLADDSTRIIPGHGPLAITEDLRSYRDYLESAASNVQVLIDEGSNLQQIIAAKPTQEWDETLGKVWITPAQFVIFIYNSLEGIHHYTPPPESEADTE